MKIFAKHAPLKMGGVRERAKGKLFLMRALRFKFLRGVGEGLSRALFISHKLLFGR